jgi:chromosome segregation ATPase
MKKLFVLVSLFALAGTALGFGLPGVGGGSINTTKVDQLIAKIDGINNDFTTIYSKVKAAKETLATVEAAHNLSGVLADAAKLQELAQALTDQEKADLQTSFTNLADVAGNIASLQGKIPAALADIPNVLTDLTNQATSNPTAIGQINTLKDKLTQAQTKLETTKTNATNAVTESAQLSDALKTLTVG